MKANKNLFIIGTGAVVLGIIVYFLIQKGKLENARRLTANLENENNSLQNDNESLKEYIESLHKEVNTIINEQPDLDETVKNELKKLIDNYENIDEDIRNELISAKALMDIKQSSKATLALVKIIENLFKKIYKNDTSFKSKYKKRPVLDNYIEFANDTNFLSKDEYHFMKGVKEIRNKEAHEVGLELDKLIGATSVLFGLRLIFKLSKISEAKT